MTSAFDPEHQYELIALANELRAQSCHLSLAGAIERAVAVCSAHEDLRACEEGLTALREITRGPREENELERFIPAAAHALTAHAIILYCRATQTSSDVRRPWFGLELLTSEQRALHASIKALRDNSIAHFGFGESHPEGPLIREAMVLYFSEKQPLSVYHSSWSLNRARFAFDFLKLVSSIRILAADRARERMSEMLKELATALPSDAGLPSMVKSHPFVAANFFQETENQEKIWDSFDEQGASVVTTANETPFIRDENA